MENLVPNTTLKWLYIDFNSYFASVEQQLRPESRGKPLAVLPVMSDHTSVIAASYEAKALGIKTGTNVGDAKRMCPGLICVEANHQNYVKYHNLLIDEVEKYIPIDTVASIDEFACELQGNQLNAEIATELAAEIKAGIAKNVGEFVKCSIGIAPNKYLAKIATDMKKPDGLVILRSEDIIPQLKTLKLRDLPGVGRGIHQRLENNGIKSVAELLELDPKHMRKIWHSLWGEKMWYLLRGYELQSEATTRKTVGHSHVITPELRPIPKAYIIAQRLMLKAASRLRRMNYYAKAMSVSIRVEKGDRYSINKTFYRASDNFSLHKNLAELWKELVASLPKNARIKKASVTLHDLIPAEDIQPDLLDLLETENTAKVKGQEKISALMDKLNAKFGRDTVVIGFTPEESASFSGTKVAFTRIPENEEFHE